MVRKGLKIVAELEEAGYEAAIAGGAVRDLLLCRPAVDIDIAVSATMEELSSVWPEAAVVGAPPRCTLILKRSGLVFELAPFRGATLEEDLAKRDVTVNAMALTASGEIVDPWGGKADMAAGVLRFTGDAARARLREDPLRAVRFARLASQFPWMHPHEESLTACGEFRIGVEMSAAERKAGELAKSLAGKPSLFLEILRSAELLEALYPGAAGDDGGAAAQKRMQYAEELTGDPAARAACMFVGNKGLNSAIGKALPVSLKKEIAALLRWFPAMLETISPDTIVAICTGLTEHSINRLFILARVLAVAGEADAAIVLENRARIIRALTRLSSAGAMPTGRDIMRITGVSEGPEVGRILQTLTQRVVDGDITDGPSALLRLRNISHKHGNI
ncbi:MAG: hypothetical protein U9R40_03090 [Synergistota bacterium]|nr:hypothetical protein [Synergistota bacterium]